MDLGQLTVKQILEKRLGDEKATGLLKEVNDVYQQGKRGKELQKHLMDAIKRQGIDPGEVKFVIDPIFPAV